jgi:uncharacterized protein YjdB
MFKNSKVIMGIAMLILGWSLVLTGCSDENTETQGGMDGYPDLPSVPAEKKLGKGESQVYRFKVTEGTRYHVEWQDAKDAEREGFITELTVTGTYDNTDGLSVWNLIKGSRKVNFKAEKTGYIAVKVRGTNANFEGDYTISWRYSEGYLDDPDIFEAPVVEKTGAGIRIKWTCPEKDSYQEISRREYDGEWGDWYWIGNIAQPNNKITQPIAKPLEFIDYFTEPETLYQYQILGRHIDAKTVIASESVESESIFGATEDPPYPAQSYTITYNKETGVLLFDPALPGRISHPLMGKATAVLVFGDKYDWDKTAIQERIYVDQEKDVRSIPLKRSDFPEYFMPSEMENVVIYLQDYRPVYMYTDNGLLVVNGYWQHIDLMGNEKGIVIPKSPSSSAVTSITVNPAKVDVEKGKTTQFTAEVEGMGNYSKTVTWTVEGGVEGTKIDASGLLTVAADETAKTLTVTATSTANTDISGKATVTVKEGTDTPTTETPTTPTPSMPTLPSNAIALSNGQWTAGSLTAAESNHIYYFEAAGPGSVYDVYWADLDVPDTPSNFADITVTAYWLDSSNSLELIQDFQDVNTETLPNGFCGKTISQRSTTRYIVLYVSGVDYKPTGSYRIRYDKK